MIGYITGITHTHIKPSLVASTLSARIDIMCPPSVCFLYDCCINAMIMKRYDFSYNLLAQTVAKFYSHIFMQSLDFGHCSEPPQAFLIKSFINVIINNPRTMAYIECKFQCQMQISMSTSLQSLVT